MGLPKIALVAAGAAVALGGCSRAEPGLASPEPPGAESPPETTASSPPATPGPGDQCGTVRTATGLTLRVEGLSGDPAGCAEARRLIDELQARLPGIGAAGHDGQVSVAVQDWLCVSRPEGAGGITCSKQDKTVSAQAVPGR